MHGADCTPDTMYSNSVQYIGYYCLLCFLYSLYCTLCTLPYILCTRYCTGPHTAHLEGKSGKTHLLPVQLPALRCSAVHCTALHCTALHCNKMYCTAMHCTVLQFTALHWASQNCTAQHCAALNCIEMLCTALHFKTLLRNILSSTALQCHALQCAWHYRTMLCIVLHCTLLHCTAIYLNQLKATMVHIRAPYTVVSLPVEPTLLADVALDVTAPIINRMRKYTKTKLNYTKRELRFISVGLVKLICVHCLLEKSGTYKSKCTLKPPFSQNMVYFTWKAKSVHMDYG